LPAFPENLREPDYRSFLNFISILQHLGDVSAELIVFYGSTSALLNVCYFRTDLGSARFPAA
jgi:hypothetical protein